ncbi:MAG: hypothetical protein RRA94_12395, partial [Bacteroidota bacterium]|nr:hypothetical protein [Bacteroidota bacterium]
APVETPAEESAAEETAAAETVPGSAVRLAVAAPPPSRRFRFVHLFGTGVATAAAAAALVLLLLPGAGTVTQRDAAPVANLSDTVYIVEKDTVTRLREVTRTVYVAAAEQPHASADASLSDSDAPASGSVLPRQRAGHSAIRPDGDTPTSPTDTLRPTQTHPSPGVLPPSGNPGDENDSFFADARPLEQLGPRQQSRNYLEQYSAMLVTVASVQLTSADRIAH